MNLVSSYAITRNFWIEIQRSEYFEILEGSMSYQLLTNIFLQLI